MTDFRVERRWAKCSRLSYSKGDMTNDDTMPQDIARTMKGLLLARSWPTDVPEWCLIMNLIHQNHSEFWGKTKKRVIKDSNK